MNKIDYLDYRSEALKRMQKRGSKSVQWTLSRATIRFSKISATSARNWDGSPAGQGQDPSRMILEKMYWAVGETPRYTNWW